MYENSIIHPHKIAYTRDGVYHVVEPGTVTVFDEYLKSEEDFFHITDNFVFIHNNFSYTVNFVISKNQPQNYFKTNITLSEFKKIYKMWHYQNILTLQNILNVLPKTEIPKISLPVYDFLCTFSKYFLENTVHDINVLIKFPCGIGIHAQSSRNLDFDDPDTWYGDTDTYYIIGYIICNSVAVM